MTSHDTRNQQDNVARDLVYIAFFAALTVVLGLIPPVFLPVLPAPITAQLLGVILAGAVLGARRGGLAILLFIALVAVGLPVLAGGRGGFALFLSGSGGFLIAFPVAAFVIGLLAERLWKRYNFLVAFGVNVVGVLVLYLIAVPLGIVITGASPAAAITANLVYVPGDLVKAVLAALIAVAVKKAYPLIRPRTSKAEAAADDTVPESAATP